MSVDSDLMASEAPLSYCTSRWPVLLDVAVDAVRWSQPEDVERWSQ